MAGDLFDIDNARSYATEERLAAALRRYDLQQLRHLVVCNRAGRFTAIFPASGLDGRLTLPPHYGFMVLG